MKKIGILTLNGHDNYGNRLQNYALEVVLKKKHYIVNTIWFETRKEKIIRIIKKPLYYILNKKRRLKFIKFSKKNLNIIYLTDKNALNKYDYILVGSDQVWNSTFNSFDETYLLNFDFLPNEKKISYAASFGIDKIEDSYKETFKEGLSKFNKISVREKTGKELIENLTNRKDIELVLDPTMLLSPSEWDIIAKNSTLNLPKKYILLYYLGKLPPDIENEIKRTAVIYGCELINVLNDPTYFNSGPEDFLYLIKNAFLICADSFHACVFSILYNKPFLIFDRFDKEANMTTRIDTLLTTFKLKDRKYNGKSITEENIKIDYTQTNVLLEKLKKQSERFLIDSLK